MAQLWAALGAVCLRGQPCCNLSPELSLWEADGATVLELELKTFSDFLIPLLLPLQGTLPVSWTWILLDERSVRLGQENEWLPMQHLKMLLINSSYFVIFVESLLLWGFWLGGFRGLFVCGLWFVFELGITEIHLPPFLSAGIEGVCHQAQLFWNFMSLESCMKF